MKRFMICLFFVFGFIFSLSAQTVTIPKASEISAGFQVDTVAHKTSEKFTIETQAGPRTYNVYQTPTGSPYILSMGSNGTYPVWIGNLHPTMVDQNGEPVRVSKSGKIVVPYIKGNGYPHVKYFAVPVNN